MGDELIQSFLKSYRQSETHHIPRQQPTCCCGNDSCAYLKYNQNALEDLERDVRTAANLGQALLMRHEAYIADSEKERKAMTAHIETLEAEKQALEKSNATVIEENRSLLDQLEAVNNAVTESDAHVTSLQATLQSAQQELQKLAYLSARTERLEQQLAEFEEEQATYQASLHAKEESERSAVRRWQQAERTLSALQEQIERIEREAKEEKERHVEVVGRMERRHEVERELTSAAGRLKGAAAAKTSGRDPGGTSVVSHFVKDILQDNTNLQMGIVELREMLQNSNDEVENLRKQLTEHQPAVSSDHAETAEKPAKNLRAELNRASSSELHVHHHYHAPPSASKAPTVRRPKKKRYSVLTPGHFTPPTSGYSTPRSSISYGTPSSAATILQQTAATLPQQVPRAKRLSTQSNNTYHSLLSSSGPSSPQSTTNRTSSLFDRVFSDDGHESSRPTTPGTEGLGSPVFEAAKSNRISGESFRTFSAPIVSRRAASAEAGRPSLDSILGTSVDNALASTGHDAIPEESEADWEEGSSPAAEDSSVASPLSDQLLDPIQQSAAIFRPALRRAASHESLLSVSGMDLHSVKPRPSQLLAGSGRRGIAPQAVISDAHAHAARPAVMSRPSDSGRSLLSGMAAEQRLTHKPSLGSKVGGWVFGRWGTAPAPTTAPVESNAPPKASKSVSRSSASDKPPLDPQTTPKKPKLRPPGINQAGPILGLGPEVKAQHAPVVKSLDEEALKRALGG